MSQFSPLIDPAGSRWDTVHTQRGTTSRLAQETEPNVSLLQCTSLKLATLYAVASVPGRLFSKKIGLGPRLAMQLLTSVYLIRTDRSDLRQLLRLSCSPVLATVWPPMSWWVWWFICSHARKYDTCVVYTTGHW